MLTFQLLDSDVLDANQEIKEEIDLHQESPEAMDLEEKDEEDEKKEAEAALAQKSSAASSAPATDGTGGGEQQTFAPSEERATGGEASGAGGSGGLAEAQGPSEASTQKQERAPNPLRRLGDLLRHWERHSEQILEPEGEAEEQSEGDALEFVEEGKDTERQVLADATEEQQHRLEEEDPTAAVPPLSPSSHRERKAFPPAVSSDLEKSLGRPKEAMEEDRGAGDDEVQVAPNKSSDGEGDDERADEAEAEDRFSYFATQPHLPLIPSLPLSAPEVTDSAQLSAARLALDSLMTSWEAATDPEAGMRIWHLLQEITQAHAHALAEQLRLAIEPTLRAKLEGDYRSGKRLNMRKVHLSQLQTVVDFPDHSVHCLPLPQGQDLAQTDEAK